MTPEELIEFLKDCDSAIIGLDKINSSVLEKCPSLKWISKYGVGLDNIDQTAAKEKNIRVINAVEGAMNAVAELVIGLMLSLAREIPRADREVRAGNWI